MSKKTPEGLESPREAARKLIQENTPEIVAALLDIVRNGEKETNRVRAAETLSKLAALQVEAETRPELEVLPVTQADVERMERHYRESMGFHHCPGCNCVGTEEGKK